MRVNYLGKKPKLRRDGFSNIRRVQERFVSTAKMRSMQREHGVDIELDTLLLEDFPRYGDNILYRRIGSPPPPEARPVSVGALKPL